MPPYVEFKEDSASIPEVLEARLMQLYGDMNKVDLYVGGLLENFENGAHVGPTFSRILAEGFE